MINSKGNGNYSALKKYSFNYESSIIISQKDIVAFSQYLQMKFFKLFKKQGWSYVNLINIEIPRPSLSLPS
jgi:hypothetical protein